MDENIKKILFLIATIKELKKNNGTIKQLSERIQFLNKTLELIYKNQNEAFDVQIDIVDCSQGNVETLFTIPSTNIPYVKLCLDCKRFNLFDLEELLLGQSKMSDILSCKSHLSIEKHTFSSFCDSKLIDTWSLLKQRVGYKKPIIPQELNNTKELLLNDHIVWCYNSSCSGKTWLGIQTIEKLNYAYNQKIACNIGSSQLLDIQHLYIILEYGKDCSLLIDDMQCDSYTSQNILSFLRENQLRLKSCNIFVFMVSWSSFANQNIDFLNYFSTVKIDPSKFELFLKEKIKNNVLLDVCGNNLSLLSKAASLKFYNCMDYNKALFECFVKTDDREQIYLVYIAAVLGKYDFETPTAFLNNYGRLNENIIVDAKFYKNMIYIGHRNICTFLESYIEQVYSPNYLPKDLLEEYINYLDGTLKWKALVHLIGTNTRSEVAQTGFIWNLLNDLMVFLNNESQNDPTWNRTPSSMYFVLLIADYFNELDKYRSVAEAFRDCFYIENNHVAVDFKKIRTTEDFIRIKECMKKEDDNCYFNDRFELGEEIDQNDMHLNWLLSLIVGLSNVLKYYGMTELLEAAQRDLLNRQNVDGSWYPYRVPWITACAMRGLAYSGITTKYEKHIVNAIEYLRSVMNKEGYWEAYTGGWNGIFETTSMCLDALNKCKINCTDDISFAKSIEYLEAHLSEWLNNDLEGISTACLLMDIRGVSENLIEYLKDFTGGIVKKLLETEREGELRSQSCAAALASFYAIELCWNILERDLSGLMDEFIKDATNGNLLQDSQNTVIQSSTLNIEKIVGNVQINGGKGTQIN